MSGFRCGLAGATLAGLLLGSITAGHAAGALAIGSCGAYGFAYDFSREAAASRAALGKCRGGCKVVPLSRACGAIAVDGKNACGAHGYAVAPRLGEAQNTALKQCYDYGGTASSAPGPATPRGNPRERVANSEWRIV